jgi:hypothetical protein
VCKARFEKNADLWRDIAPPIPGIKAKCYFNHKVFASQALFLEWLSSETGMSIGTLRKYKDAWVHFPSEPYVALNYRELARNMLRQKIEDRGMLSQITEEIKKELEQKIEDRDMLSQKIEEIKEELE